jgi:hypothetical protein
MHEIEFVHVDTLRPNPRNAHTHSKKQTHQIADSIVAWGFAYLPRTESIGQRDRMPSTRAYSPAWFLTRPESD